MCLEETGGKPDVSNYGLKVLRIGLLKICCHPARRHGVWPGTTAVSLRDVFSPWWCNVTCSAERKPGWLCKETPELFATLNTVLILSFLIPSEPSPVLRFLELCFFQVSGKVFWPKDLYVLLYSILCDARVRISPPSTPHKAQMRNSLHLTFFFFPSPC